MERGLVFKPLLDLGYSLKESSRVPYIFLEMRGPEGNFSGTTYRIKRITFDISNKEVFFSMLECGSDRGLSLTYEEVKAVETVCKNLGWE